MVEDMQTTRFYFGFEDGHGAAPELRWVKRISWAAVSQFEGETCDALPIYVRYRWGELSVWIGEVGQSALDGKMIFWDAYGDEHNFDIVWNEVEAVTGMKCIGAVDDNYQ